MPDVRLEVLKKCSEEGAPPAVGEVAPWGLVGDFADSVIKLLLESSHLYC